MVPKAEFQKYFGESWDKVLGEGRVGNVVQACNIFGCIEGELYDAWRDAKSRDKVSRSMSVENHKYPKRDNQILVRTERKMRERNYQNI